MSQCWLRRYNILGSVISKIQCRKTDTKVNGCLYKARWVLREVKIKSCLILRATASHRASLLPYHLEIKVRICSGVFWEKVNKWYILINFLYWLKMFTSQVFTVVIVITEIQRQATITFTFMIWSYAFFENVATGL